ncbi:MAG: hypothetical protein LBC84_07560 [Prevotellaceae bacterium]|jgi:hypothetical protein|nr:hypothetical protein [Prevotellaceae bacterium]
MKQEWASKKEDVLHHAKRCLYYNEIVIDQCNQWLSAEEGNEALMAAIDKREKAKRRERIMRMISKMILSENF